MGFDRKKKQVAYDLAYLLPTMGEFDGICGGEEGNIMVFFKVG